MLLALYTLAVVIFLFGFTIFVHELGHYLVARWCGMRIEVFSIGFGPAIWKTRRRGIVYKIGIIPFGGYVALPQMDSAGGTTKDELTGEEIPLPPVAPSRKIPVALAGAAGNMILAVILGYIIFWVGKPAAPHELSATVGYVAPDSPAYEQGLRTGDLIVSIDGDPVKNWNDVFLATSLSTSVVLIAQSGDVVRTLELATERVLMGGRLIPGVDWIGLCDVAYVMRGSSAEEAGILPGDRIISFDGQTLFGRRHLTELVQQRPAQPSPIEVLREGETVELEVTPTVYGRGEEQRVLIGVQWSFMALEMSEIVHPRPSELIREFSALIFKVVIALATPATSGQAAQALGGPALILKMLWDMVQESLIMALWFTCLLNVNLAILNLMPIPVLDGGHILFSLWELITRRRVNPRFMAAVISFFAILLIGAFLYITGRDIYRLSSIPRLPDPVIEELVPAPVEPMKEMQDPDAEAILPEE